jgi:hypothetical protein
LLKLFVFNYHQLKQAFNSIDWLADPAVMPIGMPLMAKPTREISDTFTVTPNSVMAFIEPVWLSLKLLMALEPELGNKLSV